MIDWKKLLEDDERARATSGEDNDDWRQEAADSLCELYYETYRAQKGRGKRLDLRPGSDFRRFMDSHLKPLSRHNVWEALFPNRASATSAQAIDEALHLLADTKLVDRVFSGDIVTVTKIVTNMQKKRAKYLELEGKGAMALAMVGDLDDDDLGLDRNLDDLEASDEDLDAVERDAEAEGEAEAESETDADEEFGLDGDGD
ncbi:MAG: hypothetical protein A2138_24670 [Deltaproteobacteria bacterium RBG_16_71_12]|nr:MAG: hypothetical protein A2138_24670 [Deltaproteobacteria bacterium RBG_16_71_12]